MKPDCPLSRALRAGFQPKRESARPLLYDYLTLLRSVPDLRPPAQLFVSLQSPVRATLLDVFFQEVFVQRPLAQLQPQLERQVSLPERHRRQPARWPRRIAPPLLLLRPVLSGRRRPALPPVLE